METDINANHPLAAILNASDRYAGANKEFIKAKADHDAAMVELHKSKCTHPVVGQYVNTKSYEQRLCLICKQTINRKTGAPNIWDVNETPWAVIYFADRERAENCFQSDMIREALQERYSPRNGQSWNTLIAVSIGSKLSYQGPGR
jgi:hypothetical protein